MQATAKIFKTGNSQAVRLPKAFRFEGDEVWLHKDEATGVVTVTPKKPTSSLAQLFKLIQAAEIPSEFMAERDNNAGEFRDVF